MVTRLKGANFENSKTQIGKITQIVSKLKNSNRDKIRIMTALKGSFSKNNLTP